MLKPRFSRSALALLLIAGCGASSAQPPQSGAAKADQVLVARASNTPDTPSFQERYPRYQVMPSDVLSVTFPIAPELNVTAVTVQPDGFIMLPNIGSIYVRGYTVPQIVDSLTKEYSKTLHNPIIAVDITNFQPPQFTVNGQVGKPGQYPLRFDITVSEGIAVAGGFLPTAKTQVFLFHRVNTDWAEVKKLDLKQLLNGHNIHEDVHIQAGDMIFVPDTFITKVRKYVPYGLSSGLGWSGNGLLNQ
ncbi:MAG: polysaccharide biosynthesis/export family protein [Candidatus Sulfotelmatobacter sp.]